MKKYTTYIPKAKAEDTVENIIGQLNGAVAT